MSEPIAVRVPQEAYAVALATLPEVGPSRLRTLLHRRRPDAAWARVLAGLERDQRAQWQRIAQDTDVQALWDTHRRAGIGVVLRGSPSFPTRLSTDPQAPAVLFHRGDPTIVDGHPAVAVVGTRSPSRYGLGLAAQLGAELTASGVSVISGLALGIDGAAHEGACAATGLTGLGTPPSATPVAAIAAPHGPTPAPPVAVVAGGLDSPYPRRHIRLWERVASCGTVVSDAPIGTGEQGWRFPQQNRILAALGDVVIVIECHSQGGSLQTVSAAADRGTPVGAVPGSVRSPASAGTNDLLADGCFVVRDTTDVLVALEQVRADASNPACRGAAHP